MGMLSTEQAVMIVEAVKQPTPEPNYYWLLLIATIPPLLIWWLKGRK